MSNNPNCTLIFYFGVTILSLILLLAIAPQVQYNVFAQDEDEKDEEEEEEQEESGGDDSSSSKEEEEEEGSSEEEGKEQTPVEEVQPVAPTTTAEPIVNLTGDQILNLEPVQNTAVETETATPPIEEFNATCSCFTNNLSNPPPPPPLPQQPGVQSQIPVSSANIVDSNSLGQVQDVDYKGNYTVANLLDNKIDDTSFWSQAGNSGFTIQFDNTLNDYQVCSIELINIHDPKGVPYFLDIGVSKNYTGIIDQVNGKIQFDKCVRDMNQIVMMFNKDNPESVDFISIGEIKLFGSKIGTTPAETTPTTIILLQY